MSKTQHICQSIVVSCIDFRLRKYLRRWTSNNLQGGFDRVAVAGGVKNLPFILDQISISVKLHHIKDVYLINHEDCGAYGEIGTFEKHTEELRNAKKIISEKFPNLKIYSYILHLDGTFTWVN